MNMYLKFRFIATLMSLFMSFSAFADDLIFINDDLKTGLNRATGEGKLIFLEFWASYCTPCKMMEEYTFTNPSVIERMNSGYIPVKINIQSFDGFDLKNQYKVTVLPTIIILDSKGRLLARYEETMPASKLTAILEKYNVPQNRNRNLAATNNNSGFNNPINKPTNYINASMSNYTTPSVSAPASVNSPLKTYNTIPQNKPTTPVSSKVGERRAIPTEGFTIQAGAYGLLQSAQKVVEQMKSKAGQQKQYILQSKSANGKITYRIFIGNFVNRNEAESFRKKAAIEGYVRTFNDFNKK